MRRKRNNNKGIIFVVLGLGLLASFILPDKFIVIILAVALIICGFSLCKS